MYTELAAVERAMRIIEMLSDHPDGLSVTEISTQLDLHKANVSRILSTLEASGHVAQDPRTGLFTLTWRLVAMAYRYAAARTFGEAVRPILQELAQKTGEVIQLAVVERDELFFVEEAEGAKPLRIASLLGRSAPLHATAAGKVYLASLPEDQALALAARRGMHAVTDATITDPIRLLEELRLTRTRGYGLAMEEANKTVAALAFPISAEGRTVHAVLAVTLPVFEATPERLEELRAAGLEAARTLSERLPPRYR